MKIFGMEVVINPSIGEDRIALVNNEGVAELWFGSKAATEKLGVTVIATDKTIADCKARFPYAAPFRGFDAYTELAEALGCDAMDSHEGRLLRAKRLAHRWTKLATEKPQMSERVLLRSFTGKLVLAQRCEVENDCEFVDDEHRMIATGEHTYFEWMRIPS